MKGITPIISIIILLLITVGLAAAAWTYMGNYFSSIVSKTIEIPTQKCVSGTIAMVIIHNMGTENINIATDIVVLKSDGNPVGDEQLGWCDLDAATCSFNQTEGFDIATIATGQYGKALINCTTTGFAKTCTYDFIVASRTNTVNVYCPG